MEFAKRIPKVIKERTEENINEYGLSNLDAFREAVRTFAKKGTRLYKAWYYDDFREYIPNEYDSRYLDFKKYPLEYDDNN